MKEASQTLPAPARKPLVRKKRGEGASRRGEILEAAKRLFTEEGFGQATMRRIAAEVGVSPTALYLHFSDKDAIMRAIASDFFSELLVRLQAAHGAELPPLARLRAGLRAYVAFGVDRACEYRLTFRNGTVPGPGCCAGVDEADLSFAVLENAVEELLEAGIFRAGGTVAIAESIWCCLHGLTSALIDMAESLRTAPDMLTDHVFDMMITGLTARHLTDL